MRTGVMLYPQFSEYELAAALSILKQGGKEIVTVGLSGAPVKGEADLTCLPDISIHEVDIDQLDSLVFPGCWDIFSLSEEQELFSFIRMAMDRQLLLAAICSSPFLLAKAGVLDEQRYTVGLTLEQRQQSGVFNESNFKDDFLVIEDRLITAKGKAYVPFASALGQKTRVKI